MVVRRLLLKSTLLLPLTSPAHAAIDIDDGSWTDTARQRQLRWRLRLPAGTASCPLVVYSHGLGGSRGSGRMWGNAWADAGIATLHLQHPGSDIDVLRKGPSSLRGAASAEQMIDGLLDVRFAIDEVLRRAAAGEGPWQRIRPEALGVAGHSFGALTTQALAGQRYPGVDDLSDPRPRAFVALSPSLPIGVKLSAGEAFAGVVRPFFALTGSLDASPIQRTNARGQRAAVYDALPHGRRALLWLAGADHQTFGGGRSGGLENEERGASEPQAPEDRYSRLIASATTAWWRWRLLGDENAQAHLSAFDGLSDGDQLLLG